MAQYFQNGKYHGILLGCGVGESKEGGKPYFFSSWELRFAWNDQDGKWVALAEPFPTREIMWSLNPDVSVNSKTGKAAIEFTMDRLTKVGFNGDWDDPKFTQTYYDEGAVLVASDSTKEYKGQKQQQWDMEMFAQGKGIEHKAAGQSTKMNLKAHWGRFSMANKLPSQSLPSNPAPQPTTATTTPNPTPTSTGPATAPPPAVNAAHVTTATREQAWVAFVTENNQSKVPFDTAGLTEHWRQTISERYNKSELQVTSEEWADLINNVGMLFPPF